MLTDIHHLIFFCTVCAESKIPKHCPLVNSSPVSQGKTVIDVKINQFSKPFDLIPLSEPPTAFRNADLTSGYVFW